MKLSLKKAFILFLLVSFPALILQIARFRVYSSPSTISPCDKSLLDPAVRERLSKAVQVYKSKDLQDILSKYLPTCFGELITTADPMPGQVIQRSEKVKVEPYENHFFVYTPRKVEASHSEKVDLTDSLPKKNLCPAQSPHLRGFVNVNIFSKYCVNFS